jgi:hypothetical protein
MGDDHETATDRKDVVLFLAAVNRHDRSGTVRVNWTPTASALVEVNSR